MGQSRQRVGRDGKTRYTAYYDDVTGRRRSAGTFTNRRDTDKAWQRAETHTSEGRNADTGRSRRLLRRYVEDEWFGNHPDRAHHPAELPLRPGQAHPARVRWLQDDRMGHARLTTTEQYLHTLPHADAAAVLALGNIRNRTT